MEISSDRCKLGIARSIAENKRREIASFLAAKMTEIDNRKNA